MQLPIQTQPVNRSISTAAFTNAIEASGTGCDITCIACNALSGFKQTLCKLAAKAAGCSC